MGGDKNCFPTLLNFLNETIITFPEIRKGENKKYKTLKTKGYHLEHSFGHGEKHLSNFLLSLNLLSFLFHTILEWFDQRYALLRKTLPSRKEIFYHIKCLTYYICFKSWTDMLIFMIKGLELEDPG